MSVSDADKDIDELGSDLDDSDEDGFHIGSRLQPPHALLYSTQELHTLIHEGVIDLNPPYQRDVVWTEVKQVKLLDSIYRNFYVPPVVFAIYEEDGEEVRRCVDGKQRLTSIQKFFDGQIPYKDPRTKKNYWYTRADSQKSSRNLVPEEWRRDFAEKKITCVEYRNLPRGTERDIFQRVQLGMPLTAAEKLQAISSPWADWIGALDAKWVSGDEGLTQIINVDMKRGRDFQSLAQLVYCCDGVPEPLMPTSQKMEQWVSSLDGPSEVFKSNMDKVLQEFWHLAHTPSLNAGFTKIKQRVAPIEFVFIGVLLYVMKNCSHEKRAEEIYNMRTHIRKRFSDVRARQDVVKVLWGYISDVADTYDTGVPIHIESAPVKKTRKRKQRQDSDEEMDEYRSFTQTSTATGSKSRPKRKT